MDSINLVAPEKPQPITAKSQTTLCLDPVGLVNVSEFDSAFIINLMYATPDSFIGQLLYDDLKETYLHPDTAKALLQTHLLLRAEHPGYRLVVYGTIHPMSVQREMWDIVEGISKYFYVSNPARGGGLHNYSLAVDIGIVNSLGYPLSVGTEVDYMGATSHITNKAELAKEGKITQQERENRILLRRIMKGAGFRALLSEQQHFSLYSRGEVK